MTHRLELSDDGDATRIAFQGVLDRAAVEDVLSHARAVRRGGARAVVLVLATGTDAQRDGLELLREVDGFRVEAESPFLARWLRQCGISK